MANKGNRFVRTYSEKGFASGTEIFVDKEAGVNYVFHAAGYAGGMTVLLDKDGKPVVTPINECADWE